MSKKRLVPKLRSKEFKNHLEWEKYTFGEIANYRKGPFGSALKKSIFVPKSKESVKIYEQQNAIDKNWKLERYFITKEYANKMKSFEVKPGDIIVSSAGTIGETYILPDDAEPGIINQALMRIEVNENKISKTLYIHLFENMIEDFSNKYSHGSAMKNIPPFSDLKSAETYFPSTVEQGKLVEFIKLFKTMINIQKRKLNKVKDIKSAYLSEMFPKEGEKYPKKRFKEFKSYWEVNHLSQIAGINKGEQLNKEKMVKNGKYYVLNGGINPSGYTNTYNTKGQTISISEGGNSCGYVNYNEEKFWSGGHNYALTNPKINVLYLYYFLKSRQDKIMSLRVGSGLPNIQITSLSEFNILYPLKDEQEKIGQFFNNLDKQISIEEEKLAKLEKLKQAYLNDMFV